MPKISAFADEISQNPTEQMDCLEANGIRYIELRAAFGVNVMKFTNEQCTQLKKLYSSRGFEIAAIASPIGKVKISDDPRKHFDDFKHAVELAQFFETPYIRIFSFYPDEGMDIGEARSEVITRLAEMTDYVTSKGITLVLENESHLFGAYPERCAYLHAAVPSEHLVACFDPANFVTMNVQDVYKTCWLPLRPHVGYFHIKDWKYGGDIGVPAGTGDGQIPDILRDAAANGYDGFLALEPHLSKGGQFAGETGVALFKTAVDALRKICTDVGWSV